MKLLQIAIMASLTLGLAPFNPPHIWKQFQNLRLGREMLFMDWVDVAMHGAPWVLLIVAIIIELKKRKSQQSA